MKLHELQYTEGARKDKVRVGRGMGSGLGKTSGRGQKVKNHVLEAVFAQVSKVDKILSIVVFLKEDLKTQLESNMLL